MKVLCITSGGFEIQHTNCTELRITHSGITIFIGNPYKAFSTHFLSVETVISNEFSWLFTFDPTGGGVAYENNLLIYVWSFKQDTFNFHEKVPRKLLLFQTIQTLQLSKYSMPIDCLYLFVSILETSIVLQMNEFVTICSET